MTTQIILQQLLTVNGVFFGHDSSAWPGHQENKRLPLGRPNIFNGSALLHRAACFDAKRPCLGKDLTRAVGFHYVAIFSVSLRPPGGSSVWFCVTASAWLHTKYRHKGLACLLPRRDVVGAERKWRNKDRCLNVCSPIFAWNGMKRNKWRNGSC